ncbi:MAG TPA: hypothetical protein VFJ82_20215 [Longimicrobium sp.]|nr:hypothetical protein [Longimicrobium sp.]
MNARHLVLPAALAVFAAACGGDGSNPASSRDGPGGNNANLTGAIYTTTGACAGVDANLYPHKDSVYANGGPQNDHASGLPDGWYFVQVTSPDGQLLGTSVGSPVEQPVHVTNERFDHCYQLSAILIRASNGQPGYDDTPNAGGEYKLWISSDRGFKESESKTDNFKVQLQAPPPPPVMPEVSVAKTAGTYYERVWKWNITKTGDTGTLTLAPGQSKVVNYAVVVTNTGTQDRAFSVSGTITVTNTGTVPATVNSVADADDFGAADAVTCGTLPRTLAVGEAMSCAYSQAIGAPTFGTTYNNTATASVARPGGGADLAFSGSKDFAFDGAAPNLKVDECVAASDTFAGSGVTGNVCASDGPKTFTYTRTFGPGHITDCGKTIGYPNTATATGTETNLSASWNVAVSYVCGCTPGYWKNNTGGWPVATSTLTKTPFPASDAAIYTLSNKTLGNYTLPQGLAFQGNSTVEGGAEILLRAANAAYLNASKFGYAMSVGAVTSQVNAALATGNRATLITLATQLDALNNAGCPLNAKGVPINP